MRLAAIDVGSNSIRLLIVERLHDQWQVIERQNFMTRIGQTVKNSGRIDKDSIRASMEALHKIAAILRQQQVDYYRAVGTNALRTAANADAFIETVRYNTGLNITVISGAEEADLTGIGASHDLPPEDKNPVLDVGGGSTEFIYYDAAGRIESLSLPLGALTAAEQNYTSDDIKLILAPLKTSWPGGKALLCGGTATTLAAIHMELAEYSDEAVHGHTLTAASLADLYVKLSALSLEERRQLPGLQPERADIIVAGALIVKTIVEFLDIPQVTISSNDLLLGLISTLQPVIQAAEQTVQKVAAFIRRRQLFACGEHILVAVSGGSDSMALLSILQTLAPLSDYHLSVAHVNHLLRPEASGDAEFVRHYCQMNNLPFYDSRINVAHWARISHQSIETAGREQRYRFLQATAQSIKATAIAVAHHQDDQAETVLFNLLRGSGIDGLAGMAPKHYNIIRPLLTATKAELLAYLKAVNLGYVLDSTNLEAVHTRNRIRLQLIPFLENDFNPQVKSALLRLADIIQQEEQVWQSWVSAAWQQVVRKEKKHMISLHTDTLQSLPLGMQRRLLRKGLEQLTDKSGWNLHDIDILADFMHSTGSKLRLNMKKGVQVRKVYNELILSLSVPQLQTYTYQLSSWPEELIIPEAHCKLIFSFPQQLPLRTPPATLYLDADKLALPVLIRTRRTGDVFQPAGVLGHQKLNKFFIDHKVPYTQRQVCPLLIDNQNRLAAVIGFRADAAVSASLATANILQITVADIAADVNDIAHSPAEK